MFIKNTAENCFVYFFINFMTFIFQKMVRFFNPLSIPLFPLEVFIGAYLFKMISSKNFLCIWGGKADGKWRSF